MTVMSRTPSRTRLLDHRGTGASRSNDADPQRTEKALAVLTEGQEALSRTAAAGTVSQAQTEWHYPASDP